MVSVQMLNTGFYVNVAPNCRLENKLAHYSVPMKLHDHKLHRYISFECFETQLQELNLCIADEIAYLLLLGKKLIEHMKSADNWVKTKNDRIFYFLYKVSIHEIYGIDNRELSLNLILIIFYLDFTSNDNQFFKVLSKRKKLVFLNIKQLLFPPWIPK